MNTNSTGWEVLSKSFQFLSHLASVDLSYCSINDNQIIILDRGLKLLSQLSSLALNGNDIETFNTESDRGTIDLGHTLRNLTNLTFLNLNSNGFGSRGDAGIVAIGNALPFLRKLTILSLGADPSYSGNDIGSTGVNGTIAIGQNLQYLSNLQYLALDTNDIGNTSDEGIAAIAIGLTKIPQLQSFKFLPQNIPVSFAASSMLNDALRHTSISALPVQLRTVQDVQTYLSTLTLNTTAVNLAGCLNDPPPLLSQHYCKGYKILTFQILT